MSNGNLEKMQGSLPCGHRSSGSAKGNLCQCRVSNTISQMATFDRPVWTREVVQSTVARPCIGNYGVFWPVLSQKIYPKLGGFVDILTHVSDSKPIWKLIHDSKRRFRIKYVLRIAEDGVYHVGLDSGKSTEENPISVEADEKFADAAKINVNGIFT